MAFHFVPAFPTSLFSVVRAPYARVLFIFLVAWYTPLARLPFVVYTWVAIFSPALSGSLALAVALAQCVCVYIVFAEDFNFIQWTFRKMPCHYKQ